MVNKINIINKINKINKSKPIIGITVHFNEDTNKYSLNKEYSDAIELAGGIPLLIPFTKNASKYFDIIDGLLISGGGPGHVNKDRLTKKHLPSLKEQNPKRYSFEKFIILEAKKRDLPMIGICRGCQMINEVFGGSMYYRISTDIKGSSEHYQTVPDDIYSHSIKLDENSLLFSLLKKSKVNVNSFHRQSIKNPPKDFNIVAKAPDGVVEAIESKKNFVVGIQFHPEKLLKKNKLFLNLFKKLVFEAKKLSKTTKIGQN